MSTWFNRLDRTARSVCLLWASTLSATLHAGVVEHAYEADLVIYSATDTSAIKPVIDAFLNESSINIYYQEFQTSELYNTLRHLPDAAMPDVVISSAADLQVKLVNDGYAQRFEDPVIDRLPDWARWRNEAFGFTFEPVVMAYNRAAFRNRELPKTHEELALAIRNGTDFYTHRIGTYDIRLSGVGYMFASQDEINSSISSRLKENLGRAVAQLHCCTSEIIDRLETGEIVLGYNLLGSYVLNQIEHDSRLGVIFPEDYTLVMSRVAFISKHADHPENAKAFMRYLLSLPGQQIIAKESGLIALHPDATGPYTASALKRRYPLQLKPIPLGPALMVYLDQLKQRRFVDEWSNALLYEIVIP
jgi:iron(III) transport system substrate-binding protein